MLTCPSKALHGPQIAIKSPKEIFEGYATVAPLAHALYRTAEAKHLQGMPLLWPMLDLGCGSGEFAQLALRGKADIGIDVSLQRLSRHRSGHCNVCLGDARRLPFADDEFLTVLTLSVLEHVHQPQRALAEVYRVLKPGGHLVGTVTLLDMHEQLFYPRLLARLGLTSLGRLYVRLHDRLFAHRSLLTQPQWEEMFATSGMELLVCRKIVSRPLTRYWDMLLAIAWPYRVLPRWAYSLMYRPPGLQTRVQKWLLPLCDSEDSNGSSLFFVARKPEESP